MKRVVISGIGVEIPPARVSNEELVASYNSWIEDENRRRASTGEEPLRPSSADFVVQASGIHSRHLFEPKGVLDPARMAPRIPTRAEEELSVQAEFGAAAARDALAHAGVEPASVDMLICASSHLQRLYPAVGVEIQHAVGTSGGALDISIGCASATSGLHMAFNLVRTGAQKRVLVVTPELITLHTNFRDRQTHFLFGDAAAAMVVEALEDGEERPGRFEVIDTRSWTRFSNAIRSNFSFVNRVEQEDISAIDMEGKLFKQVGNRVFKEVTVAGHRFIVDFLAEHGHTPDTVRRFWLHQANARMNAMILKMTFGQDVGHDRAPLVLDWLGNTAAAGAVVALKHNHEDMEPGEHGLLCAFGAGYSIGGALLKML